MTETGGEIENNYASKLYKFKTNVRQKLKQGKQVDCKDISLLAQCRALLNDKKQKERDDRIIELSVSPYSTKGVNRSYSRPRNRDALYKGYSRDAYINHRK